MKNLRGVLLILVIIALLVSSCGDFEETGNTGSNSQSQEEILSIVQDYVFNGGHCIDQPGILSDDMKNQLIEKLGLTLEDLQETQVYFCEGSVLTGTVTVVPASGLTNIATTSIVGAAAKGGKIVAILLAGTAGTLIGEGIGEVQSETNITLDLTPVYTTGPKSLENTPLASHVFSAAISTAGAQLYLSPDQMSNLPDPNSNGACKFFKELCGENARWEVRGLNEGGRHTVRVELKVGDTTLGLGEAELIDMTQYPELTSAVQTTGEKYAWFTHMEVARGLWGEGLGHMIRLGLDGAIKVYCSIQALSGERLHLFVDAAA